MSESSEFRSPELLSAWNSQLVIVDVQEKFVSAVPGINNVIEKCLKLLKGAQLLNIPCFATEQYPKGLGSTVAPIAALIPERPDKMRFSAANHLPWSTQDAFKTQQPHQIVIAGIETHVCVLQTAFDLMAKGFDTYIVVDAVGSRFPLDHDIALQRLTASGARLVTTEMVLFEWCEVAGTDEFRQMSRIITGRE